MSGHQVIASQNGTTHSFTIPADLPGDSGNHKFLIGTQGFANLAIVVPDYVVPDGFLFQPNGSVNFAGVDVMTYSALPSNGVSALDRAGNVVANAPINFAGATGRIGAQQAPPHCTLSAVPAMISAGASSTLTANCSPAADSYVWTGDSCAGATSASCTVSPSLTTSYTVAGINTYGSGLATGATVTVTNSLNLTSGWNLVGNGVEAPIAVASTFNDATKVTTVWKWVTTGSTPGMTYPAWAFYTPVFADGGQAYAASKGYEFLSTINAAEGFWVNSKAAFSVALPVGAVVQSISFMPALQGMGIPGGAHALGHGWSLIATGDNPTPALFDAALSTFDAVPPAAGSSNVYTNLTTLWAWDAAKTSWYFWAPSLVNNAGLAAYLTSKGYLDFVTLPSTPLGRLSPTTGVWVNMP